MASQRRDRTGEALIWADAICTECLSPDPQVRTGHHLQLAREGGVEKVRAHCGVYYAQHVDPERRQHYLDDLCAWIASEMAQWANMFADPESGTKLPWWEARQRTMAEMHRQGAFQPDVEPDTPTPVLPARAVDREAGAIV